MMSELTIDPILKRLSGLPAKVGNKLLGQFTLGHLDAPTLHTVLDAAELAGDVSKSLWFTGSYLFLRSKGVPVGDVIAMAKQHQRKIRLEWSEQRWRKEHNKLSRLATLKVLTEENVVYDTTFFEQHIASDYPGYLIKSSRRLGMEGLRQRHCVAGYHQRLTSQQTAILCLFLDRIRWTVELIRTSHKDLPIRIGQIKSRLNFVASDEIRKRVYEHLDLDYSELESASLTEIQTVHQINLTALLPVLLNLDIKQVYVNFSGSGDEGYIDHVDLQPAPKELPVVSIQDRTRDYQDGQWVYREFHRELPLDKAIEHIVYGYLESANVDWYNDDGGHGYFSIDFQAGNIEFEVNQNYTESITQYAGEWRIEELM
jgi:hypothetical protein